MKYIAIINIAFSMLLLTNATVANTTDSKTFFKESFNELKNMLEEKQPVNFERAIFISENPYWDNQYRYEDFQEAIDANLCLINMLRSVNDKSNEMDFSVKIAPNQRYDINMLAFTEQEKKAMYQKTLTNWAIFQYITDTTLFFNYAHMPFTYEINDPFGMANWKNSQVINLLSSTEPKGNCFALVSLYKILADRLKSDAYICTAPQHIYIQHQDHKGDYYNVELATATHPGDGTIQTLTYTFNDAIVSGISLRRLKEAKQNIALCLLHLAKSYEHKYHTKHDDFLLQCAELALHYDALNLNAMLLKAQVLEERVTQYAAQQNITDIEQLRNEKTIATTFEKLEKQIVQLYELGYYQMPMYMQEMILAGLKREENETVWVQDRTPNPLPSVNNATNDKRYSTLSRGLFEEVKVKKQFEQHGRFTLNTTSKKIERLESESNFQFLIDPVVFAWSVDPLAARYPSFSPYHVVGNNPIYNVEVDGRYFTGNTASVKAVYAIVSALAKDDKNIRAKQFKAALEKMDASGVEFHIENTPLPSQNIERGSGGNTSFDIEQNRVVIDVYNFIGGEHPVSKTGRTAHELEHGRQFLDGEINYRGDKPDLTYYDQTDEYKAFEIQNLITNTQLKPGEDSKTDDDARRSSSSGQYSILKKEESSITPEHAEKFRNTPNSKTIQRNIYNYQPTEKQQAEKKSILTNE